MTELHDLLWRWHDICQAELDRAERAFGFPLPEDVKEPPAFVRFENGPEFVSHAIAEWARQQGVACVFIDPGSPWQNAWIESFNTQPKAA